MPTLTARALKCTLVLNASGFAALPSPANGVQRVTLKIAVDGGRVCVADVAAKAIRKARAALAEHGVENVAIMIQGKMGDGNQIVEAGLVAQVKVKAEQPNGG